MGFWIVPLAAFGALGACVLLVKISTLGVCPPLRRGWVTGVVGLRGGGKSLFVARIIAARIKNGQHVAANFPLEGERTHLLVDWLDCARQPPGSTVVIDEAHQWAQAKAGRSMDPEALWYISHARKLEHEVWWISQHESAIPGALRAQTNEMVMAERMAPGWHRASSFAPHEFRKSGVKALWRWWYRPAGAAIRVYDTRSLVRPTTDDPLGRISATIEHIEAARGWSEK